MDLEFDVVPAESVSRAEALAVFDANNPGGLLESAPGVRVALSIELQESAGYVPDIIAVVLTIPAGVAADLIASWLVRILKGKAKAIVVDRTIIELDEERIVRVIQERIHAEEE